MKEVSLRSQVMDTSLNFQSVCMLISKCFRQIVIVVIVAYKAGPVLTFIFGK